MDVKIIELMEGASPKRMTALAAGYDVVAAIDAPMPIAAGSTILIPAGFAVAVPVGFAALILSRSGLVANHGIGVANAPGLIDPDYRGEVKVLLRNFSNREYSVKPRERIAQLLLLACAEITWIISTELDQTDRGKGGLGHTGQT